MFIICLLLWILFNGKITLEIVVFGMAVSAVCYALSCALLGFSYEKDKAFVKKLPGIFKLLGTLICEVVKANIAVIRMVYSKKQPRPEFTSFDAPLETTGARVALADCITLTPGTITMDIAEEEGKTYYYVHWIDVKATGEEAGEAIKGKLERGVRRVFR